MTTLSGIITPTNLVTAASTATLTNKTVALASNTVSGTIAQFNTALTDGDFATGGGTATGTNTGDNAANTSSQPIDAALTALAAGSDFVQFTGPATSTKVFTLPDTSSTLLVSGGALGTPSSGTLTNATGLPAAGVTGTAAILGANIFTGQQTFKEVKDTVFTITDAAAFEIDPLNGSVQIITLGASRTPAATNFEAGQTVILGIDDGTAYAVTWTTVAVTWVKVGGTGVPPTLAAAGYTWVLLWKVGSTIYGSVVGSP